MARRPNSLPHAALIGALSALLAFGPVQAAPGAGSGAGSGSKAKTPVAAPADLTDLPLLEPAELTPPPPSTPHKVEAPAEKAAAKADPTAAKGKKAQPTTDAPWLQKSKATLELSSKTEGATVWFDGKELGKTPLEPTKVESGQHELKLTKEGLADSLRTLRLKAGGTLKVQVDLRPPQVLAAGQAPPPLHVEVIDDEPKPEDLDAPPPLITAAGDLAGPGLKVGPPLAAPPAALRAEAPNGPRPLVKQWWFWGGVAAAAVVLTAGVVYALPPQYAEKRDPVTACGGTCGVVVNK